MTGEATREDCCLEQVSRVVGRKVWVVGAGRQASEGGAVAAVEACRGDEGSADPAVRVATTRGCDHRC